MNSDVIERFLRQHLEDFDGVDTLPARLQHRPGPEVTGSAYSSKTGVENISIRLDVDLVLLLNVT